MGIYYTNRSVIGSAAIYRCEREDGLGLYVVLSFYCGLIFHAVNFAK